MKTSQKYKHNKSVSVETSNGWVNEYDKYDRCTFHMMPNGYWCLYFYEDVKEGMAVNVKPYQVVHKYWEDYNKS